MITIKLENELGDILEERSDDNDTYLALKRREYQQGEKIVIETDKPGRFVWVKLDAAIPKSLVLLKTTRWEYPVILEENLKKAYSPNVFSGDRHYLTATYATEKEIFEYRNLALNAHDQKNDTGAYPHAFANVETRDDATFFARNAIDGMIANEDHGSYPYQSWGINRQKDAEITIDFGKEVMVDKIALVLRGDYPHDSYWTSVTLEFDDGTQLLFQTTNAMGRQFFEFDSRLTSKVTLKNLIKNDDESPFPALTEMEVYGHHIKY